MRYEGKFDDNNITVEHDEFVRLSHDMEKEYRPTVFVVRSQFSSN